MRLEGDSNRSPPFMNRHMLGLLDGVRGEEPGDVQTLGHFQSDRERDMDVKPPSDVSLNGLEPRGSTSGGEHVVPP
eukprot:3166008-Alexandrium_andersonii.AAC.1